MLRVFFIIGLIFSPILLNAAERFPSNVPNRSIQELNNEIIERQRMGNQIDEMNRIHDATRDTNNGLNYIPAGAQKIVDNQNKGDFYFFGPKIGVHAFHLKYIGILFVMAISANNKDDNNNSTFRNDIKKYTEAYANPFQAGFRCAYFFKGKFGFIFDFEYNSFEFEKTVDTAYFKSLQYVGFNLIPSVLIRRLFSIGVGIFVNFLVDSKNYSSWNLDSVKNVINKTDFGMAASIQFYFGKKLKIFTGLEFKLGFTDARKTTYRKSDFGRNMGFFMNAGFGF